MKLNDVVLNKDRLWFTADTHFSHANIIKSYDRPFDNTYQMNEALVEKWNAAIKPGDTVFHLGDVSLGSKPLTINEIVNSLNGNIYLIQGNHEKDALRKEDTRRIWAGIYDILEITVPDEEITYEEQQIIMCHYPMITWNGSHRGSWQLFGHVHGVLNDNPVLKPTQLDVGVDSHEYSPLSYQQVKELITKQHLK